MATQYVYDASDLIQAAMESKALKGGITAQQLFTKKVEYYIACDLYDGMGLNTAINTPGLSIQERLVVFAVGELSGEQAARDKVEEILASRF